MPTTVKINYVFNVLSPLAFYFLRIDTNLGSKDEIAYKKKM